MTKRIGSDKVWARIQAEVAEFEGQATERGLYHRGYRFWPPYACGLCGAAISARQFAFSRSCGGCDVGNSRTARLSVFDKRWFVLGKAELENPQDSHLIHPEFVPAAKRKEFRELAPRAPRPRFLRPARRR